MRSREVEAHPIIVSLRALLPRSSTLRPSTKEALSNFGANLILDLYDSIWEYGGESLGEDEAKSGSEPSAETVHTVSRAVPPAPQQDPPGRASNQWPAEHELYLQANYKRLSTKEIADHLGRSYYATRAKARSLGITKENCRRWSASDIATLEKQYPAGVSLHQIAKDLGRSVVAVRFKVSMLGIHRQTDDPDFPVQGERWTDAEIDYIREHCSDSLVDVAAALGRSAKAVELKYSQHGIARRRQQTAEIRDRDATIIRLRTSGVRVAQIAERLGLSQSIVQRVCYQKRS